MDYKYIVAVTNRNICFEKHFKKDFCETEYDYILGSFPMLRDISASNKDACIVLVNRILELVKLQIPVIILREKDLSAEDYRLIAQVAIYICQLSKTKLVLHNFVDIALELNYPHIHLPLHKLKELAELPNGISLTQQFNTVGASIHSVKDAVLAQKLGATYITAGHIFDTECKKGLPGRGLSFLNSVCNSVSIPVYAIGGINRENLNKTLETGASLACMMSQLM